jgi:hypothetical protein
MIPPDISLAAVAARAARCGDAAQVIGMTFAAAHGSEGALRVGNVASFVPFLMSGNGQRAVSAGSIHVINVTAYTRAPARQTAATWGTPGR